jgi:hypothetical protein
MKPHKTVTKWNRNSKAMADVKLVKCQSLEGTNDSAKFWIAASRLNLWILRRNQWVENEGTDGIHTDKGGAFINSGGRTKAKIYWQVWRNCRENIPSIAPVKKKSWSFFAKLEQERKRRYNVTLSWARRTIVAVEMQWLLHNVCMFIALGIQHAMRMCHIACLFLQYSPHIIS